MEEIFILNAERHERYTSNCNDEVRSVHRSLSGAQAAMKAAAESLLEQEMGEYDHAKIGDVPAITKQDKYVTLVKGMHGITVRFYIDDYNIQN